MRPTQERLRELKDSFDYNDGDRNGQIDRDEFVNMLIDLEAETSRAEAEIGFRAIDTDRDGAIEFDEFLEWRCER